MLYAREGADIAIIYLPEEQSDAEETKKAVEEEGREALLLPGDVRDSGFCREAVERTVEEFGRLDVLVNNAAFQQHQEKFEDISEEQWDRTFRTNIYGYFYMIKAALPHLKKGSAIVNTGSITGLQGNKLLHITGMLSTCPPSSNPTKHWLRRNAHRNSIPFHL